MRRNPLLVLCLVCVVFAATCCVSCKSTEREIIEIEVPKVIDIRPDVQLLIDSRPNNQEQMVIIPHDQVGSTIQMMANSWQYQLAWERWEDYAWSLEDYLTTLAKELVGE